MLGLLKLWKHSLLFAVGLRMPWAREEITMNAVGTQIDSVSAGVGDNLYTLGTVGTVTVAGPLRLR